MQFLECTSNHIRKNGKKRGRQNYICVNCDRRFIDHYDPPKGYSDKFKRECLKMYVNGSGFRAIEIGYDVAISEHVTIRDSDNHKLNLNEKILSPIKIGNHVWIGMNVTILKGVNIGDGAVIAAGTVVNRDIPPKTLAAGVPAIVKKEEISWEK